MTRSSRRPVAGVVVALLGAGITGGCGNDTTSGSESTGVPVTVSGSRPDASTGVVAVPSTDSAPNAPAPSSSIATSPTVSPTSSSTAPPTSSTAVLPTTTEAVVSAEHVAAIHATVEAFVEERGLNGAGLVIVDREAGIVHEDYWGEFGPDRISFIASSSKMITAGVLMRLHEDGLLDVDVPVAQQVGWTGNPEITPAQLVSNSSGLVALSREPDYAPYGCMFDPGDDLEECGRAIFETPDDDGDVIPPDTEFRYGGGQWQVAGALAEAVSGRSWSELLDEIYIGPCGVGSLGYDNQFALTSGLEYPVGHDPVELPPTDNPNMEGGAFITARDYGTLLLMHLREGRCSDGRALSAASVDRLHADRTITAYEDGATAPGYAMGWGVDRSTGRLADPGAYGSVALLDPAAGYGAYLVIEADGTTGGELWQLIATEIDGAMSG